VVFDNGVHVRDMDMPQPADGEALVRVTTAGICKTDLELAQGYMGFTGVPGHEFVGVVELCADTERIGQRVVGEINCACHVCKICSRNMPHHCPNRTVLGILNRPGAFAEYLCLPAANLHSVPDSIPDETAVFTEPLAAALRITEQLDITDKDRVVVLGDGKLGQLIAQVLWLRTKQLVVVGRHAWKRTLLDQLGIVTAAPDDAIETGADYVVEATGSPAGLDRALALVRPEGTIVLKTTIAGPTTLDLSLPVINEVTIAGSRCGPFPPAIEALELGTIDVAPLITDRFPLDETPRALERATASDAMKVLLTVT